MQGADDVALFQQSTISIADGGIPHGIVQFLGLRVHKQVSLAGILEVQVAQQAARLAGCAGRHGFHGQQAAEGPVFRHIQC